MKSYTAGQQTTLFRRQRDHASLFRTMANLTVQHAISNHRQQILRTLTVCTIPHFHAGTSASSVRHTQVKPILSSLELITCDNKRKTGDERYA